MANPARWPSHKSVLPVLALALACEQHMAATKQCISLQNAIVSGSRSAALSRHPLYIFAKLCQQAS